MDQQPSGSGFDHSQPRYVLTERKIPLEFEQIPQELIQMLDNAYKDISEKLTYSGKVKQEEIPAKPAIYLTSRSELEKLDQLSGTKTPASAIYFDQKHAILITKEEIEECTNHKTKELNGSVYEEMIHALTTRYDSSAQTIRTGFKKTIHLGQDAAKNANEARVSKEKFDFYEWSIDHSGEPVKRDFSKDKGAVYDEENTYTENTTHLAKYLMIEENNAEIGIAQFATDPRNQQTTTLASAKRDQYINEYEIRSNNRDIRADLLAALYLGDQRLMEDIAETYYKKPSSPLKVASSAISLIKSPVERMAFQLRNVIQGLKNPKAVVFSTSPSYA